MRAISIPLNIAGDEVQVRHGVTGIALESNVQVVSFTLFFQVKRHGVKTTYLD